jgi:glycine/D-amino acid oxidase-like deaminating enzyme
VRIVIIGGSAAGCFAALLLAGAGHEILVVEKERLDIAPDVESAARAAYRSTAPHIVQPHIVLARCRQLLIEHLPDIYEQLLDAGVRKQRSQRRCRRPWRTPRRDLATSN